MRNFLFIAASVFLSGILSAQKPVTLKYNLHKDKKYIIQSSSIVNQTMNVQGMDRTTETKSYSTLSLKLLDSKPDFFLAEVKFDTIKTVINLPPMEMSSADAGDINSDDVTKVSTCILNRLSNSTLVVRMNYQGEVLDIVNYEVVRNSVLQGTETLNGMAAVAKDQLVMTVDKDVLIGMIESTTAYLPVEKVENGSQWKSVFISKTAGAAMQVISNYKLIQLNKNMAVIEGETEYKPASDEPMIINGASITNELSGLGKTNMEIDPITGWRIKSTSKVQMSGNMIVNAQGKTMTIPLVSSVESEMWTVE